MKIKTLIISGKYIISSILYYSGTITSFNKLKSLFGLSQIKILAYHNISRSSSHYLGLSMSPAMLESQIKYLKKNYEIIPLPKAVDLIKGNASPEKDKFVITFDDTYKGFITEVLPLKKKYRVPMVMFITVDPLEDAEPLLVDGLIFAVDSTEKKVLDMRPYGLGQYPLITFEQKEQAILEINEYSKKLSRGKKKELLDALYKRLEIEKESMRSLVLTWDDLMKIRNNGVLIGSHTLTHPLLTEIAAEEARYEIVESKRKLEEKLNTQIEIFAYPFGDFESHNEKIRSYVKEAGYLSACSLQPDGTGRNLHALGRICMNSNMSSSRKGKFFKPLFALELSGLADLVFFRFLRRTKPNKSFVPKNKSLSDEKSRNNGKVKCLFIIDNLTGFAGTEKHLYKVTTNLNKDKFLCQVIAFETNRFMVNQFALKGISVRSLDLRKIYGLSALRKFMYLVAQIRAFSPDIVQSLHFKSDTFGACASRVARVPLVISSRRDMGHLKKNRHIYLNRLINPLVNNFISVCDTVRREITRVEKIPPSKITTIYNGVDLKGYGTGRRSKIRAREKLGIEKDAFIVGTACILRPEKDVYLLLKALSEVNGYIENLVVIILGDGEEKSGLINFCQQNGLSDKTIFPGYVEDIRDYVQAMDVVCLTPKENEGLSNVILEEMAMGKPLIATDVGGNAELVVNGKTGFVIQPGDKEALFRSIMNLSENPTLRESMGIEGRRRAEQHFSLEGMIQKIEGFYLGLLRS